MDVVELDLVTQDDEPLYVVPDLAQLETQQEQAALIRLLSFAEKNVKSGRSMSSNSLRAGLKNLTDNSRNQA